MLGAICGDIAGSTMRVSPAGWVLDSSQKTLDEAEKAAAVTHDHPEGIMRDKTIAEAI